ncbi:unnamed protein product [Closterium sp. Naga37s-1]|nr:unnamed protein product [Closterium sp. Naga37s-1]
MVPCDGYTPAGPIGDSPAGPIGNSKRDSPVGRGTLGRSNECADSSQAHEGHRNPDPRNSDPRYLDPRYSDPSYVDPRYSDPCRRLQRHQTWNCADDRRARRSGWRDVAAEPRGGIGHAATPQGRSGHAAEPGVRHVGKTREWAARSGLKLDTSVTIFEAPRESTGTGDRVTALRGSIETSSWEGTREGGVKKTRWAPGISSGVSCFSPSRSSGSGEGESQWNGVVPGLGRRTACVCLRTSPSAHGPFSLLPALPFLPRLLPSSPSSHTSPASLPFPFQPSGGRSAVPSAVARKRACVFPLNLLSRPSSSLPCRGRSAVQATLTRQRGHHRHGPHMLTCPSHSPLHPSTLPSFRCCAQRWKRGAASSPTPTGVLSLASPGPTGNKQRHQWQQREEREEERWAVGEGQASEEAEMVGEVEAIEEGGSSERGVESGELMGARLSGRRSRSEVTSWSGEVGVWGRIKGTARRSGNLDLAISRLREFAFAHGYCNEGVQEGDGGYMGASRVGSGVAACMSNCSSKSNGGRMNSSKNKSSGGNLSSSGNKSSVRVADCAALHGLSVSMPKQDGRDRQAGLKGVRGVDEEGVWESIAGRAVRRGKQVEGREEEQVRRVLSFTEGTVQANGGAASFHRTSAAAAAAAEALVPAPLLSPTILTANKTAARATMCETIFAARPARSSAPAAQRLVLIRSAAFKRVAGAYGEHGLHARLLDGIVRLLVDSGSVSSAGNSGGLAKGRMDGGMKPADFLDERSTVAMGGAVKFEGSLGNATRDRPVCFANALFTGNLKASAYPGTLPLLPARLHSHLRHTLPPPILLPPTLNFTPTDPSSSSSSTSPSTSPSTSLPRLLYISRTVGTNNSASSHAARRAFDQSSESAFQALLASLPGVAVQVADFARLSFAEQFALVQGADIIVGLHGAGLTLASAFNHAPSTAAAAAAASAAATATAAQNDPSAPRPTIPVVVEIQPYKVQHIIFEGMATSAGALYLLNQCHRGPTDQPGDATFAHVSREACRRRLECRDHFVQSRFVELTQRDVASLKRLLEMARGFVTEGLRAAEAVAGGTANTGEGVNTTAAGAGSDDNAVGSERRALHSIALHTPAADTASARKGRSWGLWGFLMGGRDRGEEAAAQGTQQGAEQGESAGEVADAVGGSEGHAQRAVAAAEALAAQAAHAAQVAWVRGWMERECGEWMSETDNNCRVEAMRSPHVRPGERCVLAADDC